MAEAGEPFLRIENISKFFGPFQAVKDVSLSIRKGEIFSLLGGSGCGKTTLLRLIGGSASANSGEVRFDGEDLLALSKAHPSLNVQFIHTRTTSDNGLRGHFTAAHLKALCADWKTRRVWACGPGAMLDAIETQWSVQGLREQLTIERFRPALRVAANDTKVGTLDFTASQQQATRSGVESILETAERAGLSPAHGCRMGICHGCDVKLKSGCVRDLRTNALLNEVGAIVQICVCAAAGDAELEV